MEEVHVKIDAEESMEVERLFMRFNGYCAILAYMANAGSLDTDKFDRKWEEAVLIENELNKLKMQLDRKYHPQDGFDYQNYSFDFVEYEMVYTR